MIPSNTRFANVKFRLKMTQLETISNSCPRGNFPGGISWETNFRGVVAQGGLFGGNCLGGTNPEIVEGESSWGSLSGGQFSWVDCH